MVGCLERGIEAFENIAVIFLYQNILALAILRQSVHQAGLVNIDKTSLADAYTLLNPRTVARHHHHATLARTLQANDQVCKAWFEVGFLKWTKVVYFYWGTFAKMLSEW